MSFDSTRKNKIMVNNPEFTVVNLFKDGSLIEQGHRKKLQLGMGAAVAQW